MNLSFKFSAQIGGGAAQAQASQHQVTVTKTIYVPCETHASEGPSTPGDKTHASSPSSMYQLVPPSSHATFLPVVVNHASARNASRSQASRNASHPATLAQAATLGANLTSSHYPDQEIDMLKAAIYFIGSGVGAMAFVTAIAFIGSLD